MKRFFKLGLFAAVLIALLTVSAFAVTDTVIDSGECGADGDNLTWTLYDDGEMVISGTGDMDDFWSDAPWYSHRTSIQTVFIPDGVTSIGEEAFYGCKSLASITIPDSVTAIGDHAFYGCKSLANITIPDSVKSIGSSAFYDCASLTSITIPDGVTTIGGYAFYGCASLTSITIPDSVTTIGRYAFSRCDSLTSVIIGSGVTSIDEDAFGDCSDLRTVEFLGNAPDLGSDVFYGSYAGEFVIYYHNGKSGWTSPKWNDYYAVCVEEKIEETSVLDNENRNSQGILFTLNEQSMTAVVGDNSRDDNNSGYYGNNDGCVMLPDCVTKDGNSYRVIGIGQHAFSENWFLKSVELGAYVTSVDSTAFQNCVSLKSFSVAEGSNHYKAEDGILYDAVGYYLYCYPAGKEDSSFTVPASVKTIGTKAFYDNSHLTELIVPDTVQTIGQYAFGGCDGLQSITLPFIGSGRTTKQNFSYVFADYWQERFPDSLKTVTITGGKLCSSAFEDCYNIETIVLPAQDTAIPYRCFYGCSSLKRLIFTDTAEATEDLEPGHVIIPERITIIEEGAFEGCSRLTVVELSAELEEIEGNVFSGCTAIKEFIVDEDNPNYCNDQWGVLYTKDMSTLVSYPASRKWPYYNVSDQTEIIESDAFYGCSNLVNLYIPKCVEDLSGSIYRCPGMTVCAYSDSEAYTYAGLHNLNAWPMDNYTLQGIEIYALPENTVAQKGDDVLDGLYLTASYGGRALQLDEYTVTYDPEKSGVQTVTVTFGGYTETFEILLYDGETEYLAEFGEVNVTEDTVGYIAVYDSKGKMQKVEEARMVNGRALLVLKKGSEVRSAKLFLLQGEQLAPVSAPILPL